jgi:hypothetical protein
MRSEDAAADPQQRPSAALGPWFNDLGSHVARLPGSRFVPPLLIFLVTLGGYRVADTNVQFYQHHVYLANAMLHGSFDVKAAGIPDYYQDVVTVGKAKYLPYGPAPAILLMPGVAVQGTDFSQIKFTLFLGAANAVLFWYLLGLVRVGTFSRWLGVIFFTFGTVHFYAATEGTLWFYNHVAAVFFLQIAIILFLKRVPLFLPAFALGLAWLSEGPILVATPFFLYGILARQDGNFSLKSLIQLDFYKSLIRSKALRDGIVFGLGLLPFGLFYLWYNQVRFGSPLDTGFQTVYKSYTNGGLAYSFYRADFPNAPHFALFDIRNIPLHIYTLFMMPPKYYPDLSIVRPSPYGLSIFLTSPAFIYGFFVKRKAWLTPACWLAIGLVTIPLFVHYSQGWVQYGYRFMLDYMPFLAILTVMGFDDHQSQKARAVQILLIAVSVASGSWGRYWGNKLGW